MRAHATLLIRTSSSPAPRCSASRERPAALSWWYLDMSDEISDEERLERKLSWYDWNRGTDALTEIVTLAEQSAKKTRTGSGTAGPPR